jgi:aspartyl protease family protein
MDSYDLGRLTYLVLLGVAIIGYFLAENRRSLGQNRRAAVVWILLFVGVIGAYGLWNDIRDDILPRQSVISETGQITVPRGPDGHFYLSLDLNGTKVRFVVDTGATDIVLTREDAARAGIDPASLVFSGRAFTANGEVRTASARIERMTLETVTDTDVRVRITAGEMDTSLLGMSYLDRFERIEIAEDRLLLTR